MDDATSAGLVLLTAACDEVEHIEHLFDSVLAQRRRPAAWVLVDDGSTDGTPDRAEELAGPHEFITVLRRRPRPDRRGEETTAAAIRLAYSVAVDRHPEAAFVAVVDPGVTMLEHGLAFLLDRFAESPELGLVSGVGCDRTANRSWDDGTGPVQVFRREVFDAIGGYRPLPDGGLDLVAAAHARLLGWRTRAFPGLIRDRRDPTSGGTGRALADAFAAGVRDRSLGVPFPAAVGDCVTGLAERPILLASAARLIGYLRRAATGVPAAVPTDLAAFMRTERRRPLGSPPACGTMSLTR